MSSSRAHAALTVVSWGALPEHAAIVVGNIVVVSDHGARNENTKAGKEAHRYASLLLKKSRHKKKSKATH